MVKRSKEEWDKILIDLNESGKSVNRFCQDTGMSRTSLKYQKKSRENQVSSNQDSAFTRLEISEAKNTNKNKVKNPVLLKLSFIRMGVEIDFPLSVLSEVITGLQRGSIC